MISCLLASTNFPYQDLGLLDLYSRSHETLFQINVKADLPVGKNLNEHPLFYVPFSLNTSVGITEKRINSLFELTKYFTVGKGKLHFII